jgi:uncharacterized membrane-anchored protein
MPLAAAVLLAVAAFAQPVPDIRWRFGPVLLPLEGGASMRISAGSIYASGEEARRFLSATGNPPAGNEALIFGPATLDWFSVVTWDTFESLGFVKANPDVDQIAAAIKRGSAAANAARRLAGRETLDVIDWREKPSFDDRTGRLEWGLDTVESGGRLVSNHFTYILGRRGVIGVELVSNPGELAAHRPVWRETLDTLAFRPEDRYEAPRSNGLWVLTFAAIAAAFAAVLLRRQRGR